MVINNVPYTSMRSDRVKESTDIMVLGRDPVTIEFSVELDELNCLASLLKPNIRCNHDLLAKHHVPCIILYQRLDTVPSLDVLDPYYAWR